MITRPDNPQTTPSDGALDAANRSIARAFALAFSLLRYAMLAMALTFVFSGWFNVREGEVAIRCRFGKVLGAPGQEILKPGGPYFAWPDPVDTVERVPTTVQQLAIDDAFWFETSPADRGRKLDELQPRSGGLVPGRDGSLLTGDQNVVHARWAILYQVFPDDAGRFVEHVTTSERAREMVRCAAEQGIVHTVARTSADELIRGQFDRTAARRAIQDLLDRVDSGITVTEVLLSHPTPPLAVRQAFLEVGQAESEKAQRIEAAERESSKIHHEAAGSGYRAVLLAIDAYELARRKGDSARSQLLAETLDRLLDGERADVGLNSWHHSEPDPALRQIIARHMTGDRVGGRVSEIIGEARSYRTQVVAQIRAEADRFQRLLPMYRVSRELVHERLWRDARQEILSGDVETFYLPDDGGKSLLLEINRDPDVRRRRETERYRQRVGEAAPTP